MCRHFAYLGDEVAIGSVLLEPPHGLAEQAWRPRRQRHGTMNVDGFGIGWYADGDPVPARYRRTGPIWADEALPDLARVVRTRAMLGTVRSASPGTESAVSAAAPYCAGNWLFSLNGLLAGWSSAAGSGARAAVQPAARPATQPAAEPAAQPAAEAVLQLADLLPAADLLGLQSRSDTSLIWAMVLARLRTGDNLAAALAGTVTAIWAAGGSGRFNLLVTDGSQIAATAAGDSLCFRHREGGVIIASEPFDDGPGWQEVPDNSIVTANAVQVSVQPLAPAEAQAELAQAELAHAPGTAAHPNGKAARP